VTDRACADGNRTTTLCVDSYENAEMKGRFYNRQGPEGVTFKSAAQFLIEMERTLDKMESPKAFNEIRRFTPCVEHDTGPPEAEFRPGDAATFQIRILFRQNASWQGSLIWMEGKQEQSFRSVLELLLLINSAMTVEMAS